MLKLPPDRYSRFVISLRILLPVVALAGLWATFKFTPEPPRGEEIAPAGTSDFALLRKSKFGAVTDGGIEVQVESDLTEWKNGVALSKNVTANVNGPYNMAATVRASRAERVGNATTVSFGNGAELSTNFGYSLVSDGFLVNVNQLDFNSVGEVFLTFPAGFGAAGRLDFEPAAGNFSNVKYPGFLKLENKVIIVFNLPES